MRHISEFLKEYKKELGTPVEQDVSEIFGVPEGSANIYYGLIRSGKTYGATADIIEELKMGRLVYASWPILLEDFDDRENFWMLLRNLLFFKKRYYKINCSKNFHFINAETGEVDGVPTFDPNSDGAYISYLNKLNHCSLYIDEAWRVIDSYQGTRMSVEGRNLILVTGHKYRTVNLISQRPTGIHVTARGNMSRFYKFVKIANWPWVRFARYEFQIMAGETVDELQEPISVKKYWAKKKIFNAYNSYFYGELSPLHTVEAEAYNLSSGERLEAFVRWFGERIPRFLRLKRKRGVSD